MLQLSVSLEQVQGLLRPAFTDSPTIVLIDNVEFEVFEVIRSYTLQCRPI